MPAGPGVLLPARPQCLCPPATSIARSRERQPSRRRGGTVARSLPGVKKQRGNRLVLAVVAGAVTFAFGISGAGDDTSNAGAIALVAVVVGLVVFGSTKPSTGGK